MKPVIAKKLGKQPSEIGLAEICREYSDKSVKTAKAKKMPASRKEEKAGIPDMFGDDKSFKLEA